jgi:hypothetical protein
LPIITAFQGTILVEGSAREDSTPQNSLQFDVGSHTSTGQDTTKTVIYSRKVTAYGETIGELLDNLVEASVTVANDVFAWSAANKSEDYKLSDDFWYMQLVYPDILETHNADPKTSKNKDSSSGATLETVDFIVKFATLVRDIQIKNVSISLRLTKSGESEIIDTAATPLNGMYEVTSFSEMTKFGFTGAELDTMLATGEKEGRLKSYRDDTEMLRNYYRNGKLPSTSTAPKKRWWNRSIVRD